MPPHHCIHRFIISTPVGKTVQNLSDAATFSPGRPVTSFYNCIGVRPHFVTAFLQLVELFANNIRGRSFCFTFIGLILRAVLLLTARRRCRPRSNNNNEIKASLLSVDIVLITLATLGFAIVVMAIYVLALMSSNTDSAFNRNRQHKHNSPVPFGWQERNPVDRRQRDPVSFPLMINGIWIEKCRRQPGDRRSPLHWQ